MNAWEGVTIVGLIVAALVVLYVTVMAAWLVQDWRRMRQLTVQAADAADVISGCERMLAGEGDGHG